MMDKLKTILIIILSIIIVYLLYINHYNNNEDLISDIRYINKVDTFIVDKPRLIEKYVTNIIKDTLTDTLYNNVVVNIPISTNKYRDTITNNENDTAIVNSYVSGYKAKLDSLDVIFKHTDKVIIKYNKPKKFGLSLFGGYGVGAGGVSPIIGVGISYSFISF